MPKSIKLLSLAKFNGRCDPYEYVTSINMMMEIIGVFYSLKCKIFSNTFKDVALWWYIGFPQFSVTNYQYLVRKVAHQFTASMRGKMVPPTFSAFTKVVHPNLEMLVWVILNMPRAWHFNESLTHRPLEPLAEVMTHAKFYIEGKESNVGKRPNMSKNTQLATFIVRSSHEKAIIHRSLDTYQLLNKVEN